MDQEKKVTQAEGGEQAQGSPLSSVYPGESVRLAHRDVWVKPWGVKALTTEVPALLGRLMGKVAPLVELAKGGFTTEEILARIMVDASGETIEFVAWSAGLTEDEIGALSAEDFMKLARAVLRQNKGFFDQLGGLYADMGQKIGSEPEGSGSESSPP